VACALSVVTLGACAAPVGVSRVKPRVVHEQLTGTVLTRGQPSEISRNVLRARGLLARFVDRPEEALAALHQLVIEGRTGSRDLYALSELSFLRAEQTKRREQYLAAVVYAWAFLFPDAPDETPER
jgi:hypothetical protein